MVAGVRNILRQHALLFERLKVAEAMRSFISHCLGGSEDLRSRLEQSEAGLAIARTVVAEGAEALKKAKEEKEAFQVEADRLRKEGDVAKAKLKETEQEISQSKKEAEELRVGLAA